MDAFQAEGHRPAAQRLLAEGHRPAAQRLLAENQQEPRGGWDQGARLGGQMAGEGGGWSWGPDAPLLPLLRAAVRVGSDASERTVGSV